ncbi:Integrin beta-1-binding protein 2 [Perkinsus olseni]|uniref:Integrin beta-1-binding protein 2 n=1 Tax=Perkinsus olseni TaxID=32597 RepID=A0A7J6P5S3_PEROL|nr:Integrin beta-1-binding protein 2 [Perkinsus olseni]
MTDPKEVLKTCRHHGCGKKSAIEWSWEGTDRSIHVDGRYTEADNGPEACRYHPGWPVFQDIKKTWTCCGAVKYEWDDFMKIPGCAVGPHTDVKPVKPGVGQAKPEDQQPASVRSSVPQRIDQHTGGVTMPSSAPIRIDAHDKDSSEPAPVVEKKEEEKPVEMKPLVTSSGKYRCAHVGCGKEPIFHDLKKEWSCCGARSYDWDDFMALPKCKTGKHEPKMTRAA